MARRQVGDHGLALRVPWVHRGSDGAPGLRCPRGRPAARAHRHERRVADAPGHLADRHRARGARAVERPGDHHEGPRFRRLWRARAAHQHRRRCREGGGGLPLPAGGHTLVGTGSRRPLRRLRLRGQGQRRDRDHGHDRDQGRHRQPGRDLRHARPRRRVHRPRGSLVRPRPASRSRQDRSRAHGHLRQDPRRRPQARDQGLHALRERCLRGGRGEARLRPDHAHVRSGVDDRRGAPPARRSEGRDRVGAIAAAAHEVRARDIMRKTITGTGGMLLLQTLKDAGVDYLFTNPGSAETGIFAAIAEDGDQRLVVGKHEGLVAAMADGYHRLSGKVGVVIAHVMGGSYQLAGQLFNAQIAGSSVLVIAGDWTSELQDHRALSPFPGFTQAESMRPLTKQARCAFQVDTNPAAITVATTRALREATTAPTGPVYLSISAALLNREGLEARIGEDAQYTIAGAPPARPETIEAMARRLGAARCPVLIFGDDVWRQGAQAEAVQLAEVLEAPVFSTRQIFANFPSRHALYCGAYPVSAEFRKISGLEPDLLFLVGCHGVHGSVAEPAVMQIGPNPLHMGRHYPLDVAAQCELRGTLRELALALTRRHPADSVAAWTRQRAKVRTYARLLIEREEDL